MADLKPTPNAGVSRAARHAPARPYIVIGSSVLAAVLLIIVVFNISSTRSARDASETAPLDIEVFGPSGLTEEDLAASSEQVDPNTRLSLPSGGGIEVRNEDGGIGQRYTFAKLDPAPEGHGPGWVQMEQPVASIYVASDRVMRLEGDQATMFVPKKALESGTMTGNVTIRLYEIEPNHIVDPAVDTPTLVVRTSEASFNNILGELRCPGDVHVETPDSEFPGHNLHMLINDRDEMVQSMTVERGEFIRIAGAKAKNERESGRPAPDDESPRQPPLASSPQPTSPTPTAAREEPFYRLTLHQNVRIEQGAEELARGDALVVTFSFRSKMSMAGLNRCGDGPHDMPTAVALSITQHIAAATIASLQVDDLTIAPAPTDEDIYVYWDGPLTMEPVTDPAQRLASADDARMELFGSPLNLAYEDGLTTVSCASLAYHTQERKPILVASAQYPGTLVRNEPQDESTQGDGSAEIVEELRITWGKALKLEFFEAAEGEEETRLKRAKFTQDVRVDSPDLKFRGDTMVVDFFAEQTDRTAIKTVLATGNIVADRPGATREEDSKLTAGELLVEFELGAEGEAQPRHVRATGDVEASDASETMWAEVIDVMLRERTAEEKARAAATIAEQGDRGEENAEGNGVAGLGWGNDRMGDSELESLVASDDVQLLLEGGTRVWADKLNVSGEDRSVTLTGENETVMIASGNHIIDQGKHISLKEIDEVVREANMKGPGVFIQARDPILTRIERKRIPRPEIKSPSQVGVRWTERMEYAENNREKTSVIEFHGQVDGQSEPSALERSNVTADTLRFELVEKPKVAADGSTADEQNELVEDDADGTPALRAGSEPSRLGEPGYLAGDRTIRRLYAAGDAKIESRTWEKEDRSDVPRVFYIAGDEIDYDDIALNASVTGKGSLLLRDERPRNDENAPANGEQPVPANPLEDNSFGSRGSTLFRFTDGMRMEQQIENRFLATFAGNVEWLHKSLDGRTATMTGQHLEAVISRRGEAIENVDLDFGGAAELERITGRGAVFIRSDAYDVECEEFVYDPGTGIAELSAKPGRTVSVLPRNAPRPFHAERVHWDMNDDKMRIIHGTLDR